MLRDNIGCRNRRITNRRDAILAQLVERIHGKDEVPSSILGDGSQISKPPIPGGFDICELSTVTVTAHCYVRIEASDDVL